MKVDKWIFIILIVGLFVGLLFFNIRSNKRDRDIKALQNEIEFYTDSLNRYTKLYPSSKFFELKKKNEELYKQLKDKEALVEAIRFEYKYKYEGKEEVIDKQTEKDSLYHFNIQTDTIGYDLKVWSSHLWKYKLIFNLTNEFTITRQQVGDNNRLEINSYLPGKIENVITWNERQKKPRFSIGPSIGVGYGMFSKKIDLFVGATLTYNLWQK